jgi:hypothetical protein
MRLGFLVAGAFALAGCSGGGDGSGGAGYCVGTFEGGGTEFGCTQCSGVDPFSGNPLAAAIDNNSGTYHAFGLGASGSITIRITAPDGMSFPAGVDAGALIRFPAGIGVTASYSLYNGSSPVAATSGGTIANGTAPAGAGSAQYYAVTPAATFDRLDLSISTVQPADFLLYEACGDR